jgi:DNA-binding protein HU-beta
MVPAADPEAYMGKNDWNSLRDQVKGQRSHASSKVGPFCRPASRLTRLIVKQSCAESPPGLASQVVFQILSAAPNRRKGHEMAAQMTKSQLIEKIAAANGVAKKDVKGVLETLADVGYKELKKTGVFLVPGFAKFVVIKKPATKARQGTNPFNGEPMTFKAKPARKIVRARPVKAAKDAV